MTDHTFTVGDLVIVDPEFARPTQRGVVYRVTRLLPVNIIAEPVAGGRPIRANPSMLLPAPADAAAIESAAAGATATAVGVTYQPPPPPLYRGQVVTIAGPRWRRPAGELYVVLRDKADGKVSVAILGGDPQGRYWPSLPRTYLTVVEPAQIALTPTPG
jgi:hypothetical protein